LFELFQENGVGEWLRLGGIELWGLIEAVWEELRGGPALTQTCALGTNARLPTAFSTIPASRTLQVVGGLVQ
jgi:hypothetical protein